KDSKEKSSILFDGNFAPIFNSHIKNNDICEFYLFDKQGSYLFLDKNAKPSWLFIRNELGIQNTVDLAKRYKAPTSVIKALEGREVILSLYEEKDFESKSNIDWDSYLLSPTVLNTNEEYTQFFNMASHSK